VLWTFAHIDIIGLTPGFSVTLMMISLQDISRHNRFDRCSGSQQAKHSCAEAKQEADDQAPRRQPGQPVEAAADHSASSDTGDEAR
jgi:hypothetical protein